jgi:cyclic pyranopterin phosphate synthase
MPPAPPTDRLSRPLRDLRISVTDRCNLRCPYCMPASVFGEHHAFLPKDELLSFEEITRLVTVFARAGVTKIRITGGEPLLRRDLPTLIGGIVAIPGIEDIALTTNGLELPKQARALADAGLKRVTVSLDSLDEAVLKEMSGRPVAPAAVLDGIRAAEDAGLRPIKINCVAVRGVNEAGIVELARHFKGSGHVLRFIEFMDVGTLNDWQAEQVVPAAEIVRRVGEAFPLEPVDPAYRGEVAARYRYKDGSGEIGIISSVTAPFCGDCTRARLTSDGRVLTCLFAATGPSLRDALRGGATDDELYERVAGIWSARTDRYSELRAEQRGAGARSKIEMYQVGG